MAKNQKRYTAQEIERAISHLEKDENDTLLDVFVINNNPVELRTSDLVAMLCQAADAEEELARLRVSEDLYKGASDNWERRAREAEARLEAVVKECERINDATFERSINKVVAYKTKVDVASDAICHRILRAARGES